MRYTSGMGTKEFIVSHINKTGKILTRDVVKACGITRQTAHQHLRELVDEKKIMKIGKTVNAAYVPYRKKKSVSPDVRRCVARRALKGLAEDTLFNHMSLRLRLADTLSACAYAIVQYAFTEMVNNAIDHSKAKSVTIEMMLDVRNITFTVKDAGIGVYRSVREYFGLEDNYEALEHLMKGKQTTDPKRHSGQGIFFTSRAADLFSLKSEELEWIVDNTINDSFLAENKKRLQGTTVFFKIKRRSRRKLDVLFNEYSNDEYEFDKTCVRVHLSPKDGMYVSRSEAKRLVIGLERFNRVILDFKKVEAIGQGFADELFRVFASRYPHISITPENMQKNVAFMVTRSQMKT